MNAAGDQLAALADPTRRMIFQLVREQPRPVGEIARWLPVSRPAVSQHLRVLEGAGLVTGSQHGNRRIYQVDRGGLSELRTWIDQLWDEALDRFETLVEKEAKMLTDEQIAPVVKTRELAIGVEMAFELFTARIAEWWPVASHSISGDAVDDVRFEGRVGGRVVEITGDGMEISWAEVLVWDPPNRFVLSWHPTEEPVAASRLEVRFTSLGEGRSRLDLVHTGWEEFGGEGAGLRAGYDSGWDLVLRPLEEAAR